MTEKEVEEAKEEIVKLEAKKKAVQEGTPLTSTGQAKEMLQRLKGLRENVGYFAEGTALTTINKLLYMQEENIRLKESLTEFDNDQYQIISKLDELFNAVNSLIQSQKTMNAMVDSEFKARQQAREDEKKTMAAIDQYLKDWR
jgi:hypothetical protein